MVERPILFSAPMVHALLAGSKTQTRRVVKGSVEQWEDIGLFIVENNCPYGVPGDRLWVRETWRWKCPDDPDEAIYRADGYTASMLPPGFKWKPSIYMPREASRITLEVTGVRVERVQDISDPDAISEGVYTTVDRRTNIGGHWTGTRGSDDAEVVLIPGVPRMDYRALWDRINGADSWEANPWVWVIEFRRCA